MKKFFKFGIEVIFLSCLFFNTSSAITYYFSSQGNDNNSGLSDSLAKKTLLALQTIQPQSGDTVRFRGGDTIFGHCQLSYNFSDTSKKVLFNAYGNGKAYLKNNGSDSVSYVIWVYFTTKVIKVEFSNLILLGNYNAINQTGDSTSKGIFIYHYFPQTVSYGDSMFVKVIDCEFTDLAVGLVLDINSYYKRGTYSITNNRFYELGIYGLLLSGICYSDVNITDNSFKNIYSRSTGLDGYGGYAVAGFYCRDVTIARNYVNNCGQYSTKGSAGIYFSASRNVIMKKNEVRNIHRVTQEGNGLYVDCGSDSCLFEYNYTQSCEGVGIALANAPTSYCVTYPPFSGFTEDSLEASYNIARFNVVVGDSGCRGGVAMYSSYNSTFQKRNMIYNNLIYMRGGYRYIDSTIGETLPACVWQFGRSDSVYIYNNIFMMDSALAIQHDIPTPGNFSGEIKNWKVTHNIYWQINGLNNSIARQRTTFHNKPFYWYYRTYASITNWADSTGLEKNGSSYTYILRQSLIPPPIYNTEINSNYFDTLLTYKILDTAIVGVNYDSEVERINNIATVDFYGDNYIDGIGHYQETYSEAILSLKTHIQGFYNNSIEKMTPDTIRVYLRHRLSPFSIIDSTKGILDSAGYRLFSFNKVFQNYPYYLVLKHRNSIETWSDSARKFVNSYFVYDFTTSDTKAYGSNQIQVDNSPNRYAMYSGDVDQNGSIVLEDVLEIYNDANNFVTGYVVTDITGNLVVDLTDVLMANDNSTNYVTKITP